MWINFIKLWVLDNQIFKNTEVIFFIGNVLIHLFKRSKLFTVKLLYTLTALTVGRLYDEITLFAHHFFEIIKAHFAYCESLSANIIFELFIEKALIVKNFRIALAVLHLNELLVLKACHISFTLVSFHIIILKNHIVVVACTIFYEATNHIKKDTNRIFACLFVNV